MNWNKISTCKHKVLSLTLFPLGRDTFYEHEGHKTWGEQIKGLPLPYSEKQKKTDIFLNSHWFFFNKNLETEFENVNESFENFSITKRIGKNFKWCKKIAENLITNIFLGAAVWIKHEKRTFCSAAIDSFSTFLAEHNDWLYCHT